MDPHPPTSHRPVRVTLAHDCELVLRGLVGMLASYAGRVVFVAPEEDGTPAHDVDITLHDFLSGLHLVPTPDVLPTVGHGGRLVAFTWHPRPDLVDQALSAGVTGVLAKTLSAPALVAALEAIHRGDVVVEYGTRPLGPDPVPGAGGERRLTPRESEIVRLITRGLDNSSIAREASLSINSVKSHIRSAYRKMGVGSRAQAVLWGVRNGYLEEAPGLEGSDPPALTG